MLCLAEELGRDVPPDQVPLRPPLRPAAVSLVELLVCRVEALPPQLTRVVDHRVPSAEPNGRPRVLERGSSRHRGTDPSLRVGVQTLAEERLHLRLGHLAVDVHRDPPTADPASRRVPLGEVVVAQRLPVQRLMIAGRHLSGQIRVPVPGMQHMHRHHCSLRPPIRKANRSVRHRVSANPLCWQEFLDYPTQAGTRPSGLDRDLAGAPSKADGQPAHLQVKRRREAVDS